MTSKCHPLEPKSVKYPVLDSDVYLLGEDTDLLVILIHMSYILDLNLWFGEAVLFNDRKMDKKVTIEGH